MAYCTGARLTASRGTELGNLGEEIECPLKVAAVMAEKALCEALLMCAFYKQAEDLARAAVRAFRFLPPTSTYMTAFIEFAALARKTSNKQVAQKVRMQLKDGLNNLQWNEKYRQGMTVPVKYPWMGEDELCPGEKTIEELNVSLLQHSAKCMIQRSGMPSVNFGLFARGNIKNNRELLVKTTILCAANPDSVEKLGLCCSCFGSADKPVFSTCCNSRYCSSECMEEAARAYHPAICGKDFSFITEAREQDKEDMTRTRMAHLFIRAVAHIICEGPGIHPLQSSCMKALSVEYDNREPRPMSFELMYEWASQILSTMGINVHHNPSWEIWIIQVMFERLRRQSNKFRIDSEGTIWGLAIHTHAHFVNHNCEPNCTEIIQGSVRKIVSNRKIARGEELTISYLDRMGPAYNGRASYGVFRREEGGHCRCGRCENMRAQAAR